MKSTDRVKLLLFASLGTFALGLGFFNGHAQEYKVAQAKSKLPEIEVKDGIVELGLYPQTIVMSSDSDFDAIKASEHEFDVYTYKNEKYTYVSVISLDSEGGGKWSNGEPVQVNEAFFKWEPIKWQVLYDDKEQNATFLFAKQVITTFPFQALVDKTDGNNWKVAETEERATSWASSMLRTLLNENLYKEIFSNDERDYLKEFNNKAEYNSSNKDVKDHMTIISPTILDKYKNSKNIKGGASDYAKARGLHYHFHDYEYSFSWVNRANETYGSKNIDVVRGGTEIYGSAEVDAQNIGVRPLIALDLSKVALGGGQSEGGTVKKTTNVGLIIGIIFSVLGIGGLIAFLTLWSKGKLSPAMGLKAIIPILAACVVVSSVGLISLTSSAAKGGGSGGGGGIGCTFKPGYYLQSTAQSSGSSSGIDFVQVGYTCYLFKSDGTVKYCASVEKSDASDFVADGGHGTWTKSGCSLSFNYVTPIGSVSPTFTISGNKLYYGGTEAYHWVRGE